MTIWILTLFPEVFSSFLTHSIIKRALAKKIIKINLTNIRDFAKDARKTADDTPYGGGAGMVLKADILYSALKSIKPKPYTILLSASGAKYTQNTAKKISQKNNVAIICGHYEGIDARIEKYADQIVTIGDYILTGGEIPAMVLVDSITRFIKGSINPQSPQDESFEKGLLEYPQFTRPENFRGQKVPKVLLSGNHQEIKKWREEKSEERTKKFRPDLL